MITLLLHLLRLLPFVCGGHRQLAFENLALRHQRAVYKRTALRPLFANIESQARAVRQKRSGARRAGEGRYQPSGNPQGLTGKRATAKR